MKPNNGNLHRDKLNMKYFGKEQQKMLVNNVQF